jgi:hypothetical protein
MYQVKTISIKITIDPRLVCFYLAVSPVDVPAGNCHTIDVARRYGVTIVPKLPAFKKP